MKNYGMTYYYDALKKVRSNYTTLSLSDLHDRSPLPYERKTSMDPIHKNSAEEWLVERYVACIFDQYVACIYYDD